MRGRQASAKIAATTAAPTKRLAPMPQAMPSAKAAISAWAGSVGLRQPPTATVSVRYLAIATEQAAQASGQNHWLSASPDNCSSTPTTAPSDAQKAHGADPADRSRMFRSRPRLSPSNAAHKTPNATSRSPMVTKSLTWGCALRHCLRLLWLIG